jgi:hypothetical protein
MNLFSRLNTGMNNGDRRLALEERGRREVIWGQVLEYNDGRQVEAPFSATKLSTREWKACSGSANTSWDGRERNKLDEFRGEPEKGVGTIWMRTRGCTLDSVRMQVKKKVE